MFVIAQPTLARFWNLPHREALLREGEQLLSFYVIHSTNTTRLLLIGSPKCHSDEIY